MSSIVRKPIHAGSWYDNNEKILIKKINKWLNDANNTEEEEEEETNCGNSTSNSNSSSSSSHAQAIITPHAGYRFCGNVMAHAYKNINPDQVKRVFILGPLHHIYSTKCILSSATYYGTPFGNIELDLDIYDELKKTEIFSILDIENDEYEYSLEMQLPYITYILKNTLGFKLIPIMVGQLSNRNEIKYGEILAPYLDDPQNLFIISSDFCHWGNRFHYTPYDKTFGPIWKYIENLDRLGMNAIESIDPRKFKDYLNNTGNTICGQKPITILLYMLSMYQNKYNIKFVGYDQSTKCMMPTDESVSYASAIVTINN